MTEQINILYLCTGNSCRSQMAEGWTRCLGGDHVGVQSAGIEAHGKNIYALTVMAEAGIDISGQESTVVTSNMVEQANIVVTVCGHADEQCPVLPPGVEKIHWPLSDPAGASGAEDHVLQVYRGTRDEVERRVRALLQQLSVGNAT